MVLRNLHYSPSSGYRLIATAIAVMVVAAPGSSADKGRIPPFEKVPKGAPSFFVTSRGMDGGNLGALAHGSTSRRSASRSTSRTSTATH
jgi:hypothetical protein